MTIDCFVGCAKSAVINLKDRVCLHNVALACVQCLHGYSSISLTCIQFLTLCSDFKAEKEQSLGFFSKKGEFCPGCAH